MKKRILIFIITSLTIALATYSMRLINLDASWFERSIRIQYASYYLSFILPFLIVFLFFQKFTKIIAGITTFVLFLCLVYGFCYVGSDQMLSHYLIMTIGYVISVILLTLIILKDSMAEIKNNSDIKE